MAKVPSAVKKIIAHPAVKVTLLLTAAGLCKHGAYILYKKLRQTGCNLEI